tara:strand:- start:201 stop:440 length:240 start_codon:yes stop_codon:yes gene_type:complete
MKNKQTNKFKKLATFEEKHPNTVRGMYQFLVSMLNNEWGFPEKMPSRAVISIQEQSTQLSLGEFLETVINTFKRPEKVS